MTLAHDTIAPARTDPAAPVVLLLHSGVCDRRMWDGQTDALTEAGYRVLRPDFRGFGDSPCAEVPYSDAGDVLDLMRLSAPQAAGGYVLVGSSYGGRVALEVAGAAPEAVRGLLLLCAGRPGRDPGPELRALGAEEDALIEAGDIEGATELMVRTWLGPEADEEARAAVREMQARAYAVRLAAPEAEDYAENPEPGDLATLTVPCLAVSGAHDLPEFGETAAELAGLLPHARHLALPWAGHLPSLERPAWAARTLLGFLAELRREQPESAAG